VSVKRRSAIGTTELVKLIALKTGRSVQTIWRWKSRGCILDDPKSVRQFLEGNKLRQSPNLVREGEDEPAAPPGPEPDLNQIDLGPIGPRGAPAALSRLENVEERSHARLLLAIEEGDPFKTRQAQEFYLRASEVLRRLDIAVLTERRQAGEQVPKFLVEQISAQISGWLRTAFEQFLSSESPGLMAIADLGEFKHSAIESFLGILHATAKSSLKSDAPIPERAAARVREAGTFVSAFRMGPTGPIQDL
jgi:hypothetical protein